MRAIALIILSLMVAAPAAAQYPDLRPRGAVPDGCKHKSGHPDCHPDRTYNGRSVASSARHSGRPAYAGDWGYNHYAYGPNCLRYGYPPNCAYWELPDWNGPMEIRNPGGG
jgi:hypothetical protein